ncbi:hypothetical protein PVAP13_4NG051300 [Panicum virgatum]|uniref:Uncharacterized protein n=1 Tax=Panicum virgatum TaxID=38727 RepID=A0A8T0SXD2_PANVG|nr:hypothetical protein PVAP13_4NG051300 [Panicum virgatum]
MDRRDDDAHAACLVVAGFLVLTLSSGAAVCRAAAAGDTTSVAFVVAGYATLLLLLACLRAYERAPSGEAADGRRGRLRRAVWSLTTLLTVMFAWRVAAVMPSWPAALLVWALAAATSVGSFVALFRPSP